MKYQIGVISVTNGVYSNDTATNFGGNSRWHALFRLEHSESLYSVAEQVSYEMMEWTAISAFMLQVNFHVSFNSSIPISVIGCQTIKC